MQRALAMVLLVVGIGLAAAFGARNGESMVHYRAVAGAAADGADADKAAAAAELEQLTLPPPGQRLTEWLAVGGAGWGLGVVLIIAGAFLARQQQAREHAGEGSGEAGRLDFAATLDELRARIDRLATDIAELPMDDDAPATRDALDRLSAELLEPAIEGRGQLIARHGLATFASYFGPFSAGERKLARCWSALTDGHAVVARQALAEAAEAFDEARTAWEGAESKR